MNTELFCELDPALLYKVKNTTYLTLLSSTIKFFIKNNVVNVYSDAQPKQQNQNFVERNYSRTELRS